MATQSLPQFADSPHTYSIKEFQLLVKDAPAVPAEIQPFVGAPFTSSRDVFKRFEGLAQLPVESFIALHLNGKNRIVGMTTCSIGSMTASLAHPRDIFRPAIANLTAGLIFIHNHPSGDPEPSQQDLEITRRLAEVGRIVGIKVLDHVIVGQGRYFSFADSGLLF